MAEEVLRELLFYGVLLAAGHVLSITRARWP
jgi:hypothetical protein